MTIIERNALIEQFMPLAEGLACGRYKNVPKKVQLDELKSAAYFGLVDAAIKYEPDKPFVAYAKRRICGEMQDYLRTLGWGVQKNLKSAVHLEDVFAFHDDEPYFNDYFEKIIEILNPFSKKIVRMYYVDGLPLKEIGRDIGVGEARVSQILKECRKTIRKHWNKQEILA